MQNRSSSRRAGYANGVDAVCADKDAIWRLLHAFLAAGPHDVMRVASGYLAQAPEVWAVLAQCGEVSVAMTATQAECLAVAMSQYAEQRRGEPFAAGLGDMADALRGAAAHLRSAPSAVRH